MVPRLVVLASDAVERFCERLLPRWAAAWPDALAASVAAGLAWVLSYRLLGHQVPVFAAVSALICLAPGLPSHGRQAVYMMIGLVTGILVAEPLLLIPVASPELLIVIVAFPAMMVALAFGLTPVLAIQSGVSAVLVIAMGPAVAGTARLLDAAIGAGVALLFSQALLTPDPVHPIDAAARRLFDKLADAMSRAADAARSENAERAQEATSSLLAARAEVSALEAALASARSSMRWSVRGRLAATNVTERLDRYGQKSEALQRAALAFGAALVDALRTGTPPPPALADRAARAAAICRGLAGGERPPCGPARDLPPLAGDSAWRACLRRLRNVETALARLCPETGQDRGQPPRSAAPSPRP